MGLDRLKAYQIFFGSYFPHRHFHILTPCSFKLRNKETL